MPITVRMAAAMLAAEPGDAMGGLLLLPRIVTKRAAKKAQAVSVMGS